MQLTERLGRIDAQASLTWASRRLPPWLALVLALALAWQLARLTWLVWTPMQVPDAMPAMAQPSSSAGQTQAHEFNMQNILEAHLFGRLSDAAEPVVVQQTEVPETRLNLQLRGVITNDIAEYAVAIIADNRGRDQIYRVGQQVPGGARLHAVQSEQVVLNRAGSLESLRLPREFAAAAGGQTSSARPAGVIRPTQAPTSSVRDVISDNAVQITEIIRVQPYMEGGSMRGYRVYPGRNRQQFTALGLQPGDLVVEINGQPMNDPSRGMQIFAELGDANSVSITVEREGVSETMMLDTSQLARAAEAPQ
jgi:general secretion pathway protein C